MNKNELLEKMKERNRLSKSENQLAVDTFINIIYEALQNGEKVSLKGFGQFVTKERKSRNIRIPSSEKEVRVPAKEIPAFEPGEEFKNKVERIIE
ncbi:MULTISPECIES: HU family DNA-binding protein [Bacillus]|uniref:HU family DNA-binding protein n=2 Tax=Bacillus thuringiensis TaxID=1428 RepID=A0A9X6VBU2_BACTU|nr:MULTISPECIES: HU family DNA-binding protein [Bacillus]AFV22065.1 DNA-binding protein HU [Bacillus thuringiensis Bt407]EEM24918.1 DNA-binding protein HU [Bacillus thuringiensis Bt407]ERI00758.1 DNA-binding protein HU [Bacillus thuringiensis T01-328]MBN6707542.1 HU family DNA-binding protein [Bacillus thuringiensis]MDF9599541.1 HU family DNA-binding protein [Bacillus cereus]